MTARVFSTTAIALSALAFGTVIANGQTTAPSTPPPAASHGSPSSAAPPANSTSATSPATTREHDKASSPSQSSERSATPGQPGRSGESGTGSQGTSTRSTTPSGATSGSSSQTAAPGTSSSSPAATAPAVNLTTQQKTEIRNTVINTSSAPRVASVNFNLATGVVVPATVHFAPVPATILRIEPAWKAYQYFVYADQIIIVDPHTRRIIAILVV